MLAIPDQSKVIETEPFQSIPCIEKATAFTDTKTSLWRYFRTEWLKSDR